MQKLSTGMGRVADMVDSLPLQSMHLKAKPRFQFNLKSLNHLRMDVFFCV
jgi:hypothetical protein